jgi:hypothetical protein
VSLDGRAGNPGDGGVSSGFFKTASKSSMISDSCVG